MEKRQDNIDTIKKALSIADKKLKRQFLGSDNPSNTFEKKELNSYLKGQSVFTYKGQRFQVRQKYYYS